MYVRCGVACRSLIQTDVDKYTVGIHIGICTSTVAQIHHRRMNASFISTPLVKGCVENLPCPHFKMKRVFAQGLTLVFGTGDQYIPDHMMEVRFQDLYR
jgi:hypothetical protein